MVVETLTGGLATADPNASALRLLSSRRRSNPEIGDLGEGLDDVLEAGVRVGMESTPPVAIALVAIPKSTHGLIIKGDFNPYLNLGQRMVHETRRAAAR